MPASNVESESVTARRQVFASSLNSASPPFYPSGSSNKDIALMPKRDVQAGSSNRNFHTVAMDDGSSVPQTNALLRGKNIAQSVGMDKLYIDESISPGTGKALTNPQMPLSGSSLVGTTQSPPTRVQGKGLAIPGQTNYQPNPPHRVSPLTQFHTVHRNPSQSRVQPFVQAAAQQPSQRPGSGSRALSPPKTVLSINSHEPGEVESSSESNKSKVALVGKGKGNAQGTGRGSVMYGGSQVMGATGSMAVGHGDQNFPGTPTFLPGKVSRISSSIIKKKMPNEEKSLECYMENVQFWIAIFSIHVSVKSLLFCHSLEFLQQMLKMAHNSYYGLLQ
jgi:hypothetical protein